MMTDKPAATLTYTLTLADAQAWERLPRELKGWGFVTLLCWVGSVGGLAAFLPTSIIGDDWGYGFFAAMAVLGGAAWGVAILARQLAGEIRAWRRAGRDLRVKLRQWNDHLEVDEGGKRRRVGYDEVSTVSIGDSHVFIATGAGVLIVPERAFRSQARMQAFGQELKRLLKQSAR